MKSKTDKNALDTRMKRYEAAGESRLVPNMPIIIRLDGKAFHTFTRGMRRPFDDLLRNAMEATMLYLCQNVQNTVFGFTQSDEITLVLVDYKDVKTDAWFDGRVQKMASIAAAMATMEFNRALRKMFDDLCYDTEEAWNVPPEHHAYLNQLEKKLGTAMFDARVFNLPVSEVANNLIWRQQDAVRNSIQMVGQSVFSHKELLGKKCNEIQEMLFQKGINWNDYPVRHRRGSCCYRKETSIPDKDGNACAVVRPRWYIDVEPPIFTQDREFIERHI